MTLQVEPTLTRFPINNCFTPMDSKPFDFIPRVTPMCRKCNLFLFHHFQIVRLGDYAHSINSAGYFNIFAEHV